MSLVSNKINPKVKLWLGPMNQEERKSWEEIKVTIIRLKDLEPWGESVKLFNNRQRETILGWKEEGN